MTNKVKFAVLGAGNVGSAMAAYLAIIGCDVKLYNRTQENINNIQQCGGIYLRYTPDLEDEIFPEGTEHLETEIKSDYSLSPVTEKIIEEDVKYVFGKINTISSNIKEVIRDRDVIIVAVTATGHKYIARECAPYLRDGQTILLSPGRCFGAIEFYKIVNDYYKPKRMPDITIAEAQTSIYTSRYTTPRSVRIFGVKFSVDIATIPSFKVKDVVNLLGDIYPQLTPTDNILKTSLGNVGGIFHVPITILNTTKIDRRQNFKYYIDGITEHTAPIIEDVDKERLLIAKELGVKVISARKWLYQKYGSVGADLYEAIQNTRAYREIKSPESINHRYIWEDVPASLVPLSSLGKKLQIPTPMIDSFIYQAISALRKYFNIDFFESGRTMENLGLKDMSIGEIKRIIETGY